MTTEEARLRAEKHFKQEERARDGRAAMVEYEAHAHHTRANMARLRALRLAKEAKGQKPQS